MPLTAAPIVMAILLLSACGNRGNAKMGCDYTDVFGKHVDVLDTAFNDPKQDADDMHLKNGKYNFIWADFGSGEGIFFHEGDLEGGEVSGSPKFSDPNFERKYLRFIDSHGSNEQHIISLLGEHDPHRSAEKRISDSSAEQRDPCRYPKKVEEYVRKFNSETLEIASSAEKSLP